MPDRQKDVGFQKSKKKIQNHSTLLYSEYWHELLNQKMAIVSYKCGIFNATRKGPTFIKNKVKGTIPS